MNRELTRSELERVYDELAEWCRARGFVGHDPFDALNSRLFQATPLRHASAARLVLTQLLKRAPVSPRRILRVAAGKNPKGEALFALAALARFRATADARFAREAHEHLEELLSMRLEGTSGAAWGYNFDWQSRNFFAPRGTPTLVPTAFAARAFIEAAHLCAEGEQAERARLYAETARGVCTFILRDLPRSVETAEEVCFSYVPLVRTRIFNASLLAGETLASVGALTGERELCEWAVRAARYVVRRQREDGSWTYGAEWYQSWIDNFHTAFILDSLSRIIGSCGTSARDELMPALRRGYEFWRARFFLADGWPKYYHDNPYPADIHAAAAAVVALVELRELDDGTTRLADTVARWAVRHMRDRSGFFYYQRRRFYTIRTPYMRWAQAWMLYALARLLEAQR